MLSFLLIVLHGLLIIFLYLFIVKMVLFQINHQVKQKICGLVVITTADSELKIGMIFNINKKLSLGREASNDLAINDPYASLKHALIIQKRGRYWILDQGSLNGTYLNKKRLEKPVVLKSNDLIKIGNTVFQFKG
ncbi:MAG: FHA domain-containing protein [Peptococcaceae bacterium]